MADFKVPEAANHYSKSEEREAENEYNAGSSYDYTNRQDLAGSTQYTYQKDVSNNFVGLNDQNDSTKNLPREGEHENRYFQEYNSNNMNQSEQMQEDLCSENLKGGPCENATNQSQSVNTVVHTYSNPFTQAYYAIPENTQVNSQNYYSQTDKSMNDKYSTGYDGKESKTERKSENGDDQRSEEKHYREDRVREKERSEERSRTRTRSVSRSRASSRSESHRRHRRRSRNRSYERRHRRRSRTRSRSPRRSRSRSRRSHRHRSRRHRSRSLDSEKRRERRQEKHKERKGDDERRDEVVMDVLEKARMLRSNEIEKRRQKDIEEAQRDDLTVLVANMSLSVDERDIYELFSEHAGKVRDIQCVRDSRSGRSKGIAYVEFYTQEAVIKALSMTGMSMKGQGIRVQSSQAEKNRAGKAARQLQETALKESDNPTTIIVSNLVGVLNSLGEADLQQLFAPFGNIVEVAVARNESGGSKGYAYIRFKRWNEAKEALNVMNGFDITGQQIKVAYATNKKDSKSRLHSLGDLDIERLDDDDAGLISGSNNKIALMKKLQQRQPVNSSNIVLSNMFTSSDYEDNRHFFDEIEEDVKEECSKYGKVVQVYVNRRRPDGKVYVKFRTNEDAQAANKGLQGRYFAGNTIQVAFLTDEHFVSMTSKN